MISPGTQMVVQGQQCLGLMWVTKTEQDAIYARRFRRPTASQDI